jgi:hypothetical protein
MRHAWSVPASPAASWRRQEECGWSRPAGLRYAGLDYDAWSLVGWKAAHVAAVARMRLHLERQYPGAPWESERAIRVRWHGTGARVRIPDGIIGDHPRRIGVEVELHRKGADRYAGILADRDPDLSACWWYVQAADVAWLRKVLDGIACPIDQLVFELPEGIAP